MSELVISDRAAGIYVVREMLPNPTTPAPPRRCEPLDHCRVVSLSGRFTRGPHAAPTFEPGVVGPFQRGSKWGTSGYTDRRADGSSARRGPHQGIRPQAIKRSLR